MGRQIEVEIEVEKPCRIQVVRHSIMHYVALTIRSTLSCVIAHLVHFYRVLSRYSDAIGARRKGDRISDLHTECRSSRILS